MYNSLAMIVEEVESPINGKIQVVKSLAFGTYIQVEGLTQSGGVVYDVWRSTLRKIRNSKPEIRNCLILGLGGGSAAKLARKYWPKAQITGVEIDPIMVDLGKKYLGLGKTETEIVIEDAYEFLLAIRHQPSAISFDLILVDLYVGYDVPEKFETEAFIRSARGGLAEGGVAVFNRLYSGEKKVSAMKFGRKLEKVFSKVIPVYPEANVVFVCSQ